MKILEQFPYKKVLVLGLAKSGTAAAELLLKSNINVIVNDKNANETNSLVQSLRKRGAEVVVGSHPITVLNGVDLIVKNPGISYEHPIIKLAEERNIKIITEIELAYELVDDEQIIGITGSNGKTTTTMLAYEMLSQSETGVKLAGNIGIVATEVAQQLKKDERLLLELSSFQLLGINRFRPQVGCLLNLYDAHLDYHHSKENYERAKAQLFSNQTEDDYLIYNKDNGWVVQLIKEARAHLVPFSTKERLQNGAWTDGISLYFKDELIISLNEVALVGEHNIENMLAAIAIAKLNDIDVEIIQDVLRTFSGVKHRLQFVKELNGRLFYNDSKATNILATQKALRSFSSPTILLAGGLNRGEDFSTLLPYLTNVKAIISFGETKDQLAKLGEMAHIPEIFVTNDVSSATKIAYKLSTKGDIILLSPACASWDQYKTFEQRGDMFIKTVHTLL